MLSHLARHRGKRSRTDKADQSSKKLKYVPPPALLPSIARPTSRVDGDSAIDCCSEFVFSTLTALLSDFDLPDRDTAIQDHLRRLQQTLSIASPQGGYHHCFEFLLTSLESESAETFSSKSQVICAADGGTGVECKISLFENLDGCLRLVENKQQRFRKRLEKKQILRADGLKQEEKSSGDIANRRARRQHLQSEAQTQSLSHEKSTAAVSHYIVISQRQREVLNNHYKIFLGEGLHSSLTVIGKAVPAILSGLLAKIFALPSLSQSSPAPEGEAATAECRMKIAVFGSIQFFTRPPRLEQAPSSSSVILEDLSLEVAADQMGRVPYVISARGPGSNLTLLRCRIFGRPSSAVPYRGTINLIEIADGCQGHIVKSALSGSLSQSAVFCQSLISCSCKSSLIVTESQLSDSEQSLILLLSASSLTLDSSHCSKSQKSGLHLSDAARVTVANSEIEGNGRCGVEIFSTCLATRDQFSFTLCRIYANKQSGILVYNSCGSVDSCLVSGNGWANISCQQGATLSISNSTLTKSSRSGIHASGRETCVQLLGGNLVADNGEGEVDCIDGARVVEPESREGQSDQEPAVE
jgi:hypothetical protein